MDIRIVASHDTETYRIAFDFATGLHHYLVDGKRNSQIQISVSFNSPNVSTTQSKIMLSIFGELGGKNSLSKSPIVFIDYERRSGEWGNEIWEGQSVP